MADEFVCSAANRTLNLDRPPLFQSGSLINRGKGCGMQYTRSGNPDGAGGSAPIDTTLY